MRIKHYYCLKNKFGLLRFLNRYEIPYQTEDSFEVLGTSVQVSDKEYLFELYEDQKVYEKFKQQFPFVSRLDSITTCEYSQGEIEEAQWLFVRNKSVKVQWEYDEYAFQRSCGYKRPFQKEMEYRHEEQIGYLSVTKPVRWGTRQFFSGPNAADDLLFCSDKTRKILGSVWKGLEFWPVKKYASQGQIKDLYQLYFAETLPMEAIANKPIISCPKCGKAMIRIPNPVQKLVLDKNYLKDQTHVYKTGDVLTEQKRGYHTSSFNIVSQEFYQYCERYGMNRSMVYEPVKML